MDSEKALEVSVDPGQVEALQILLVNLLKKEKSFERLFQVPAANEVEIVKLEQQIKAADEQALQWREEFEG